jgi:peptidoglycan/LPS O-acetylase OafA/YrhL
MSVDAAHRANAFDFLRLTAALLVFVSHAFAIGGYREPTLFGSETAGTTAVHVFFVISGYLVTQSWLRDPHLLRFLQRRALRIFPGLLVMTVLTVLLLGPLFTEVSATEYWTSGQTWRFFWGSVITSAHVGSLPGLFLHNPLPGGVNGSLWSLRYELSLYVVLGVAGLACGLQHRRGSLPLALGVAWLACIGWGVSFRLGWTADAAWSPPLLWRLGYRFDTERIANLSVFFLSGALLQLLAHRVKYRVVPGLLALAATAWLPDGVWLHVAVWAVLPYAALAVALDGPRVLRVFQGYDYSYGIYIYAFPLQQAAQELVSRQFVPWWSAVLMSCVLTVVLGALSWRWVERPALRMKPASPVAKP